MIRALLDTNTLFSGIYKPSGAPGIVLRLGFAGTYEACVTEPIIRELAEILTRPRTKKLFDTRDSALTSETALRIVQQIQSAFTLLPIHGITHHVASDPNDSHVFSAAVQNEVNYLVSGDKRHVLPLDGHAEMKRLRIRVVSPAAFLEVLIGG